MYAPDRETGRLCPEQKALLPPCVLLGLLAPKQTPPAQGGEDGGLASGCPELPVITFACRSRPQHFPWEAKAASPSRRKDCWLPFRQGRQGWARQAGRQAEQPSDSESGSLSLPDRTECRTPQTGQQGQCALLGKLHTHLEEILVSLNDTGDRWAGRQ